MPNKQTIPNATANTSLPKLKKVYICYNDLYNFFDRLAKKESSNTTMLLYMDTYGFSIDLKPIKGRTDSNTLFVIISKGKIINNQHYLYSLLSTERFFKQLTEETGNHPLNIHLKTLHAASAARSIRYLPENSVLVCHGFPRRKVGIFTKLEEDYSPHIQGENFVQNIVDNFYCFACAGSLVNVKLKNGVFSHAISPFYQGQKYMYNNDEEYDNHLLQEKNRFVMAYEKAIEKEEKMPIFPLTKAFWGYKNMIDCMQAIEKSSKSLVINKDVYSKLQSNFNLDHSKVTAKKNLPNPLQLFTWRQRYLALACTGRYQKILNTPSIYENGHYFSDRPDAQVARIKNLMYGENIKILEPLLIKGNNRNINEDIKKFDITRKDTYPYLVSRSF